MQRFVGKPFVSSNLFRSVIVAQRNYSLVSYHNSMVKQLVDNNNIKQSIDEFKKKPNAFDANFLISKGRLSLDDCFDVYNSVPKKTIPLLTSIINQCKKNSENHRADRLWDDLVKVLQSMSERELKTINQVTWNVIISGLSKANRLQDAIYYYKYVVDNSVCVPDNTTVMSVMSSCGSAAMVGDVEYVFGSLDKCNIRPTVAHYSCMVKAFVNSNNMSKAMDTLSCMIDNKITPDAILFTIMIKGCTSLGAIETGQHLHTLIKKAGISDTILADTLINMYSSCGKLDEAVSVFKSTKILDSEIWTTMISAFRKHGKTEEAIDLFHKMLERGQKPTAQTFSSVMNAVAERGWDKETQEYFDMMNRFNIEPTSVHFNCLIKCYLKSNNFDKAYSILMKTTQTKKKNVTSALVVLLNYCSDTNDIAHGERLHTLANDLNVLGDPYVSNSLINMYSKAGNLEKAMTIFSSTSSKDAAIWNSMISANAKHGKTEEAIDIFHKMLERGQKPTAQTFSSIMNAVAERGWNKETQEYFDMMNRFNIEPTSIHFNCLIKCYLKSNNFDKAYSILMKMIQTNVIPDNVTFVSIVNACIELELFDFLDTLFEATKNFKQFYDNITANTLLNTYIKRGNMEKAISLFETIERNNQLDAFTCTTMISAYGQHGRTEEATGLFKNMLEKGQKPTAQTFSSVMNAVAERGWNKEAHEYFDMMRTFDITPDRFHYTCLIKALINAKKLPEAMEILYKMIDTEVEVDVHTLSILLVGCAEHENLEIGKSLHSLIEKLGINDSTVSNCLIEMYSKCGKLEDAIFLFKKIDKNQLDVFTWTTMISAYGQHGRIEEAIELFKNMLDGNQKPNSRTFSSVMNAVAERGWDKEAHEYFDMMRTFNITPDRFHYTCLIKALINAKKLSEAMEILYKMIDTEVEVDVHTLSILLVGCADTAAFESGKILHNIIDQLKITDMVVNSCLIEMYAKCGRLNMAESIFNRIPKKDLNVITWNVMISACAQHGDFDSALKYFNEGLQHGFNPTEQTMASLLTACSHTGNVSEGLKIYHSMESKYGVAPSVIHKSCVIDIYGRAGKLEEAEQWMVQNNLAENVISLVTLLGACRKFNDVERAERIFKYITTINKQHAAAHVLLANIYSATGNEEKAKQTRELMERNGGKKIPGKTFIEIDGVTHSFVSSDTSHPRKKEIYAELEKLNNEIIEAGYVPDTTWVTKHGNFNEEEKKQLLCHHSEKIAMAFGFISLPPGSTLTLTKNLRVCGDCHNATKVIAQVRKCEIIVRDGSRFHHFKDGKCSCGDYW